MNSSGRRGAKKFKSCRFVFHLFPFFSGNLNSRVNIRSGTSIGKGLVLEKFSKVFVIPDSEFNVSWDNSLSFVLNAAVSSKLENFSAQIFHDGSHDNWSSSSNLLDHT